MFDIIFVNESTLLTDVQAYNIAWACDWQARFQFGRSGWRGDVRCYYIPGGPANARIPVGSKIIHFLDTADQAGALGYHDEAGNEVAYGRVFVKTARDNGDTESEVASHETMEMAGDPNINLSCLSGDGTRLFALEVADACQGNGYDVGAPEGRTLGIVVADFLLPSYFDPNTHPDAVTDFRGALKGPFALGPQGYYSYVDMTDPSKGWQQVVGHERTKPINDAGRTAYRTLVHPI